MPKEIRSCVICGNTFITTQVRKIVCSKECGAKRSYKRSVLRERYKHTRDDLNEAACKIIERYLQNEHNGSNYLNSLYVYRYGQEENLIPDDVKETTIRQYITRNIHKFGFHIHIRKGNVIFARDSPCVTIQQESQEELMIS
jgi:hypothetical protein